MSDLTIKEYADLAMTTAQYPAANGLSYVVLGLNGEAGEVAEKVKKMIRDDDGILTESRRAAIKKELGDVFWYLVMCCKEAGLDPADVAQTNLDKLFKRKEAGTIKGDGDDR